VIPKASKYYKEQLHITYLWRVGDEVLGALYTFEDKI
jgi:hypothetical protein